MKFCDWWEGSESKMAVLTARGYHVADHRHMWPAGAWPDAADMELKRLACSVPNCLTFVRRLATGDDLAEYKILKPRKGRKRSKGPYVICAATLVCRRKLGLDSV